MSEPQSSFGTDASLRERLLMTCLEKMDDPARAFAQALAMVRFIEHGEPQNAAHALPLALPKPEVVGQALPEIEVDTDGVCRGPVRTAMFAPQVRIIDGELSGEIDRGPFGRVQWTERSLATLKKAVEENGFAFAAKVFGQKESSIRVKAYQHGIRQKGLPHGQPAPPPKIKTRSAAQPTPPKSVAVAAPVVKLRPQPQALPAANSLRLPRRGEGVAEARANRDAALSVRQKKADELRAAIVWLEKKGFELNFDAGLYDVWPKDDEDAGSFGIDKTALVKYARTRGWGV